MAAIEEEIGEDGKGASEDKPLSSVKKQPQIEEEEDDEDDDDDIEETITERLIGLTEMVPESVLNFSLKSLSLGYWFTRRSLWVLGTSAALLLFPAFIEQQRQEIIAMQDMQTKQLMLGQGAGSKLPM